MHVAGLDSAWRQHLLQHSALEHSEYGARGHEGATASVLPRAAQTQPAHGTTHAPHMSASGGGVSGEEEVRGPLSAGHGVESHALQSSLGGASPALSASPADLNASLRTLGANLVDLARTQPMDLYTVAAAPRAIYQAAPAIYHGARRLVPRLAGQVSPLLASMVKELNETIAVGGGGGGNSGVRTAVTPPTRAALRQHDEDQLQLGESREAADEAAAVLAQLPARARQEGHRRRERERTEAERPQLEQHEAPRNTGDSGCEAVSPHTSETARHAPVAALRCGTPIRHHLG